MAGMLAGVESARRRRIHQSIVCSSTPPPSLGGASLCLRRSLFFPTSSPSSPSLERGNRPNQGHQVDEKLGQLARQAKKRLDERLHAQSKSPVPPRNTTGEGTVDIKKKKKKGWGVSAMARLGGTKAGESESECVICLEEIKRYEEEEEVVKLECSHTFHAKCITPWLHSHSICPCCRTPASSSYS